MIIPRDKSPERNREYERTYARSLDVNSFALEAEAALYGEFGYVWAQQPIPGASSVIDHAFLEANIEYQNSRLSGDRAISEAQRGVSEAFDELPA